MFYQSKNFAHLFGLPGFSDAMLKNHFTLYEGYVKQANQLQQQIQELVKAGKGNTPPCAELRRRFGWEFNGMRLHEYYFGNLRKGSQREPEETQLAAKLCEDFGSLEDWEKDFQSAALMRGIGWVVLTYDPRGRRLCHAWIDGHDTGLLAGCLPLLVFDAFEHAYALDYGLNKKEYMRAFLEAADWQEIRVRFSGSFADGAEQRAA